ncbi:MAG: heavy metal translocating P-type ATPase [Pseudomonadota bacterium]
MIAVPCYHCGQPTHDGGPTVSVDGARQPVCCFGCKAVYELIQDNGLGHYYRDRQQPPSGATADTQRVDPRTFQSDIRRIDSTHASLQLYVEGMYCSACSRLVELTLTRMEGVAKALVDPLTHRLTVEWQPAVSDLADVLDAITGIGYRPKPLDGAAETVSPERAEQRTSLKRLLVASLGMMQVMMFAIGLYAGDAQGIDPRMAYFLRLVSLAVTTPVVVYAARPFFIGALRGVTSGRPGMDLPVALAIGLAYLGSIFSTFTHGTEVWFDSVTMFVFFLTLGRHFELRARVRATEKADALRPQLPNIATVIRDDKQLDIPIDDVRIDDILVLMPGDQAPVDGVLLKGSTSVDESVLTGESHPQTRQAGEEIPAGSINLDTSVQVRVLRTGQDTVLGGIQRLASSAQLERPQMVQTADRIASYFISAILVLATGVAIAWSQLDPSRAFVVTLTVLVVTCPCALALATPTAFAAVHSWLSTAGLLLKNADAVEALARADRVVFDKTGTLTVGQPTIAEVHVIDDRLDKDSALQIAAALERNSRHPLARGFADVESSRKADNVRAVPGHGVEGVVDGKHWQLGTLELVSGEIDNERRRVCLGRGGECLAEFTLADRLRVDAKRVVESLRDRGFEISLLSGDGEAAVRDAAAELGIADWQAAMTPDDKLGRIRQWQADGEKVVMVGDGINDAPVIGGADASIAPSHAADVAQTQADIIMLGSRLEPVATALKASRATLSIVRQNIAWAILYNALALPAAAAGLVPTWLAAIGMSASSLLVVMNSLRLSR